MKEMDPSTVAKVRENLEIQLSELETLQSIYTPTELKVEDVNVLASVNAFVDGRIPVFPPYLDLTLNLVIEGHKFELCINLSHEYPKSEPDLFVRNHKLNKLQHAALNKDLCEYVSGLDRGEPCIFSAISWLQDNSHNYLTLEEVEEQIEETKDETLVRYWIYSHHIYSKSKRREIVDLAEKLKITGFCMPGKPGIICVEGKTSDCSEWWQIIKSMNWKRIYCKISEECKDEVDFLKFRTFEEVVFQTNSVKCNHMNMGELYQFLEEHKCGYIFKDIFGVEVKNDR